MPNNRGLRSITSAGLTGDPLDLTLAAQGRQQDRPGARRPGRMYWATDTRTLFIDLGGSWASLRSASALLAHGETSVVFNTSSAENDLVNFSVPANTLVVGDSLRLTAFGDYLHNTADTMTVRMYLGNVLLTSPNFTGSNSASRVLWKWEGIIQVKTATTQNASGVFHASAPVAGNMGLRPVDGVGINVPIIGAVTAAAGGDIATALAARLTYQFSSASASNEIRMFGYSLEQVLGT